jgi:UDP-GlcNAc:undecaprenyl-phosphate GlcNAc-1-phosphate transferase
MSFIVLPALAIAFVVTLVVTPLAMRLAWRVGAVSRPDGARRLHARPTPELGGLAVVAGVVAAALMALALGWLPDDRVAGRHLAGLGLAVLVLCVGGFLDDWRRLSPRWQLATAALAAGVTVASGVGVAVLTNPFGGTLELSGWLVPLVAFAWLIGMTFTTKLLDGVDGLVSGVTAIGGGVLALLSLSFDIPQPGTAYLAAAVSGAFLGFLVYNATPARVFLGEGGSTFAGFALGGLAILSGGKIATALLALGLPLFDLAFVVLRRTMTGRPVWQGGRDHLHHRLLDAGLTPRQVAWAYYGIAAAFGLSTLVLPSWGKLLALVGLVGVLLGLVQWSNRREEKGRVAR